MRWPLLASAVLTIGSRLAVALPLSAPRLPPLELVRSRTGSGEDLDLDGHMCDPGRPKDEVPTGITRRAHSEWWTIHPPPHRRRGSELPQCFSPKARLDGPEPDQRPHGREPVPSYVGPAPAGFGWDPKQLREAMRGRRVVLIGDSITREWLYSLECYLTGAVRDHAWSGLRTGRAAWPGMKCAAKDDMGYTAISLEDVHAEIKLYMGGFEWPPPVDSLLSRHAKHEAEEADLVIIGQGAHFNNPSATGNASLRNNLLAYMKSCKALGASCVLREPTPSHFWYPEMRVQTGLFHAGPHERRCISSNYSEGGEFVYDTAAEWRKEEVHEVLRAVGQPDSVFRIFDALMPATYAHLDGDCLHPAFDTEYWEPWHAELFRLLKELPPGPRHGGGSGPAPLAATSVLALTVAARR